MKIKDTLVSWYIKNVLMPKTEDITHPGFLVTKLTKSTGDMSLREIAFPENLFVDLENKLTGVYGEPGGQVLYSIGKKFGYGYASLANLPQLQNSSSEKEFLDSAYYMVMYVASLFAGEITHTVDIPSKKFEADMTDYIICRKNGLGYILSSGGIAGIWDYAIGDIHVEGVQTACSGRGSKKCHIVCSTPDRLNDLGLKYYVENELPTLKRTASYEEMNTTRPPQYAQNSLEDLINTGFFDYREGKLNFKGERYFICEAHLMYFLEKELQKLPDGEKILFDVSFDFGKNIAENVKDSQYKKFMMDYLPALGYGDVLVSSENERYKIISSYFPWTEYFTGLKFVLFRGICSGMLSGFTGKSVTFDKVNTSTVEGYLDLIISS